MVYKSNLCFSIAASLLLLKAKVNAQEEANYTPPKLVPESQLAKVFKAGWKTEKQAHGVTLIIPPPRGQIVDRGGEALAQNRVVNYVGISMPFFGEGDNTKEIITYVTKLISRVGSAIGKKLESNPSKILLHYTNRRWLPFILTADNGVNEEITPEQLVKLQPLLTSGLGVYIQKEYLRIYTGQNCAAHIIGFTGKVRPMPTGPINDGQPLFEEVEGRSGLEKSFDSTLQGNQGLLSILFDENGSKIKEEITKKPLPGSNLVTTIDINLQKIVEKSLAKYTQSSAMVVIEVKTGDVLAMASHPSYDPNIFIPSIPASSYEKLKMAKNDPLTARAYQGAYPPASTFKIIVAEAALETGQIKPDTTFECAASLQIGDRVFHNWSPEPEGGINVVSALKRSCNTWFYQAGITIGSKPILDMAQRFGFGEPTGIPLAAEHKGFLPSETWTMQKLGHKMLGGDIANLAIGQGSTLVTPLQAARAMAGLADGSNMPEARLVKQIQDDRDHVIKVFPPKIHRKISLDPEARTTVIKGMLAVVYGDRGTGHAAQIEQCQIAGKTGTAQWNLKDDRSLAWFTGFLPVDNPVYAFAVVYEGQPGQKVHGGSEAAPIVHEVFDNYFKSAAPDEPVMVLKNADQARKAIPVAEDSFKTETNAAPSDTRRIEKSEANNQSESSKKETKDGGIGGFFRNLFKR